MKKWILAVGALWLGATSAGAQTVKETAEVYDSTGSTMTKTKTKPKTTTKDKAYNLVHRNKKRSSGTKTKTTTETVVKEND